MNRRSFILSSAKMGSGLAAFAAAPGILSESLHTSNLVTRTTWAMGMPVTVKLPKSSYELDVVSRSFDSIHRVDRNLSSFISDSIVGTLNRNPGQWFNVHRDMASVAAESVKFGHLTEGRLDVTVAPLLRKYGFIPSESLAKIVQENVIDFSRIEVAKEKRVRLGAGVNIDFGGIAKGYGLDEMVFELRAAGKTSALVEAGGDIFAVGRKPDGTSWNVGIRNPLEPSKLFATVALEDQAIATSGGYYQRKKIAGDWITHLIDPVTGTSANHVLSATIVAQDAMTADALATATSIQQPDQSRAMIESLPDVEGLWIYEDKTSYATPGLSRHLSLR